MTKDSERAASRASHSSSSDISRTAALNFWESAPTPEKKREGASAVVANTESYQTLCDIIGVEKANAVWIDAGKSVPAKT